MFDTKPYDEKFALALEHYDEELKKVRTGRAHPGMLDGIAVEVYGTRLPLNQAANITAPEAQMLLVTPFDPGNIQNIVAAIRDDKTHGFNPSDDGRVVRVPIPALTEERRKLLVKQAGEKAEEARIALRNVRQDALKDAKRKKDAKELSEDDYARAEKLINDTVTEHNTTIDERLKAKEKDVLTV